MFSSSVDLELLVNVVVTGLIDCLWFDEGLANVERNVSVLSVVVTGLVDCLWFDEGLGNMEGDVSEVLM